MPISGPLIQEKALQVAKIENFENFSASNGWLEKFRIRHAITFKSICGESKSVDTSVVKDWTEKLEGICEGYADVDIWNLDETGLFFKALPDKTMCLRGEKCSGGKLAKERLTLMLCVNAVGDFLEPLIIGKSARPRCFKNLDLEEDLQNLINVSCGAHFLAKDYNNIDKELEVEISSNNLSELVQQTKAEENELSDDEEEEPRAISSAEVEECFQKLRHYFLINKDAHGLEESANLQMHFENMQSKKPKTQKSITDYLK